MDLLDIKVNSRRGGRRCGQIIVSSLRTLSLIGIYYACSIGLTFYMKNLLVDFKFPLSMVLVHLSLKFILAGCCRFIYSCYTNLGRVMLPWNIYWKRVFPPGAAAAVDIGLSQWALKLIPVALYTMSKSTALLFILMFAILLKLEEMRWSIVILVILIAGGLFMFTYQYTQFNLFGFILVMIASAVSGLRWTLSQLVMQKSELGLSNPIDMVYHMQPWMTLALLPLAVFIEGIPLASSCYGFRFVLDHVVYWMWFRVICGAIIAFCMEVSEFLVVSYTSSLTFSISGVVKEIITLLLAVYTYDEKLSLVNQMGLVLCVVGITLHVAFKTSHASYSGSRESSISSETLSMMTYQQVPLLNENSDGKTEDEFDAPHLIHS